MLRCEFCNYSTTYPSTLKKHKMRIHNIDVKWHACNIENCTKQFKTISELNRHKKHKHKLNIVWYICNINNCNKKFKTASELKFHKMRIHNIEIKWHVCDIENCTKQFKTKYELNQHKMRIHNIDIKWHVCDIEGCNRQFKTISDLKTHQMRIHNINIKWHVCDIENCNKKFKTTGELKSHKMFNHDIKTVWYNCNVNNCPYKTKVKYCLKRHFNSIHTEEGKRRQKKQEQRIEKLFNLNNISYDRETRINFNCFNGTCAYIDFVLYKETHIIVLEIDEFQHKYSNYTINCDIRRMNDIYSAIRCEGKTIPILFIRYNPHSFLMDGKTKKIYKKERETKLLKFINEYIPKNLLEIQYMYYDIIENSVLITKELEYNENIKKCVLLPIPAAPLPSVP